MEKVNLIGLILLVVLVGCTQPSIMPAPSTPPSTPTPMPTPEPVTPIPTQLAPITVPDEPPKDKTWISPGKVQVGNFYPGARAEWMLTINNGNDGVTSEVKKVTTDPGEVKATIPVRSEFYRFIKVTSDNAKDKIVFVSGEGKGITFNGFEPNSDRVLTIDYIRYSQYSVKYREPDYVAEGYVPAPKEAKDWVIIADPTPIFLPREKKEILVAVEIPKDIQPLPKRWEFWISVIDISMGGNIQTELASRWLINMR